MKHSTIFNKDDVAARFRTFDSYTPGDMNTVLGNEEKITSIARSDALAQFIDDIRTYFAMLRDTVSGAYRAVPFGSLAAIVCTLLYVLSPVDLVPDVIPVVGLLDDAAMLGLCLQFTKYDVKKYREWKARH